MFDIFNTNYTLYNNNTFFLINVTYCFVCDIRKFFSTKFWHNCLHFSMATQRIAGVVIRRAGHSNCHFKFSFTNGSKISRTLVVKWLPPSSTAVIVLGNNPNTQLRWSSTQASSNKGMYNCKVLKIEYNI